MPYWVMVDDNYHHMDSSERYCDGEFATADEALARCRAIVDEYLDAAEKIEGRSSARALWESYMMFGDDPFVVARDAPPVHFSAWDYARECCERRCGGQLDRPWAPRPGAVDDGDPATVFGQPRPLDGNAEVNE
ncbi:MAG: hypothetical protein Fur0014_10770 [Rubrivivax sp.]